MSLEHELSSARLTLDLWHPDCWAIEATDQMEGGILAHAVYNSPKTNRPNPNMVRGLFTAFGNTVAEVQELLDVIRESDRAGELFELQKRPGRVPNTPGNVVREFFLEYDPNKMVCPTLLENNFVHSAPARIQNGSEEWNLSFAGNRSRIEESLEEVCDQSGAEVTVTSITTHECSTRDQRLDTLTPTQREVFEYAREAGYYEWPREITTRELAAELDIAKSTLLEHLRTAESKLLNP